MNYRGEYALNDTDRTTTLGNSLALHSNIPSPHIVDEYIVVLRMYLDRDRRHVGPLGQNVKSTPNPAVLGGVFDWSVSISPNGNMQGST